MNKAERLRENTAPQDFISLVLSQDRERPKKISIISPPSITVDEQVVCDFSTATDQAPQQVKKLIILPQKINESGKVRETSSESLLVRLVEEERLESISETSSAGNKRLIDSFFDSERYGELVQEFDYFRKDLSDNDRYRTLVQEFKGAVFEGVAEEYFKSMFSSETRTVIGSQRTDRFFQAEYPDVDVRYFNFGKIGLRGITVPDSLVVEGGEIIGVGEFSLRKVEEYYHKKHSAFTSHAISSQVKALYQGATQVFLVPENFPLIIKEELEQEYDDLKFIPLPFTNYEFYSLASQ